MAEKEVVTQVPVFPVRELADRFWQDYGLTDYSPKDLPPALAETELFQLGREVASQLSPKQAEAWLRWGGESIIFAHQFGPDAACGMRKVCAATSWDVAHAFLGKGLRKKSVGSLTVCGMNGLPPDHIEDMPFTPEETAVAVHRILKFFYQNGTIVDEARFQALSGLAETKIEGKILNCVQIGSLLEELLEEDIHYCRRRTAGSLPKSACPSILCAEGDSFANRGVGQVSWLLLSEPGLTDLTVMPVASFSSLKADQRLPLLPSEYRIPYRLTGKKGVREGTVYMSVYSVLQLTRAGTPNVNVDLREVRKILNPAPHQVNIQIDTVGGVEPGYFDQRISFFDPADPNDRTASFTVDPYDFEHSWRYGFANWQGGRYPGEHGLDFTVKAQVTSDVPCPRCTKAILREKIPLVVVDGKMSLSPTYYESADLYYLLTNGVTVLNKSFLSP